MHIYIYIYIEREREIDRWIVCDVTPQGSWHACSDVVLLRTCR